MTPLISRRASRQRLNAMITSRMSLPSLDLQETAIRVTFFGGQQMETTLLEFAESQRVEAPGMLRIIEALIRGENHVEATLKIEAIPSQELKI